MAEWRSGLVGGLGVVDVRKARRRSSVYLGGRPRGVCPHFVATLGCEQRLIAFL